jgi:hypothetical protein
MEYQKKVFFQQKWNESILKKTTFVAFLEKRGFRDQKTFFLENHFQKDYTLSFSNCFFGLFFLKLSF